MKSVEIEWRRLLQDGATCDRCGDTGTLLEQLIERLHAESRAHGVVVALKTIALNPERIAESSLVRSAGCC
jgi:transcriptional regulator of acetoin/glycerol metabolism